ncbi:MAG: DUF262 domain-containing protein [Candidatus Methanoperedens sp.]
MEIIDELPIRKKGRKPGKELEELEKEQYEEDNFNEVPPIDIVAFNELRSCADLLRLYTTNQLEIQPDFQRQVVWSNPAQTRFIDSLSKQLPIPSMCISLDYKTDKRLIIDGLQRMQSIINFLSDDKWELSELDDIDAEISGKTVHTIKTKSKNIYDRVQNVMIPITVIRCDYSKKSHNEYLFTIFHRLNSGGLKLNNQEIRNCIYNGSLNTFLKHLTQNDTWKKLLSIKASKNYRFSNEELILRFFAFVDRLDNYNGRLSNFLNQYMFDMREPGEQFVLEKTNLFERTTKLIYEKLLEKKSAASFSKTLFEGLLYGVAENIDSLEQKTIPDLKMLFQTFQNLPDYSLDSLKGGLSAREKVITRLTASETCFSN